MVPPLQERVRYSPQELADLRYKIQVVEANADMDASACAEPD